MGHHLNRASKLCSKFMKRNSKADLKAADLEIFGFFVLDLWFPSRGCRIERNFKKISKGAILGERQSLKIWPIFLSVFGSPIRNILEGKIALYKSGIEFSFPTPTVEARKSYVRRREKYWNMKYGLNGHSGVCFGAVWPE